MAELRNWSLAAYNKKMYNGDYAFIYVNQQTATEEIYKKITNVSFYSIGDGNDEKAQKSLQNFFIVSSGGSLGIPVFKFEFKFDSDFEFEFIFEFEFFFVFYF